jgi:pimeloyl-ACP methyl ester carboxylesterase
MSVSESLGTRHELALPLGKLTYRERGQGEPLLLLAGLLVNGDSFRRVVPHLAERFRCITPDLPLGAHQIPMPRDAALTMPLVAELAVSLLDALGIDRATLVGNDAGGVVSQLIVAWHPERVERLVLACCDAFEDYPPEAYAFLTRVPRIPGAIRAYSHAMRVKAIRRSRFGQATIMQQDPEPAVVRSYLEPARDPAIRRDIASILGSITTKDTLDAASTFPSFERPVLIAWGGKDRLFKPSTPTRLAKAFPAASLITIPDSLTYIPEDAPEELATAITRFIETTPVSPQTSGRTAKAATR